MANQTDYFNKIGYKPVYHIGDRVIGKWKGIPFVATVGNDRNNVGSEEPEITVHLDLPMFVDGVVKNFLIVKHKDVKLYK